MPDTVTQNEQALLAEIARLNKVVHALMDQAERSAIVQGSDFNMFQTTIMLEDQVRQRTRELEVALHHNQTMTCALRESEAKFRGLVSQSLVGITVIEDGRFTYANAKFAEMFGYTLEEALRLGPLDIAAEESRQLVAEQVRRRLNGEVDRLAYLFRGLRRDRTVADVECHSSVMDIGGKTALISLLVDVTERLEVERRVHALQEQLREQAIHDPLTGLYNRHPLSEFFDRELTLAERRGHSICTVMGDLDHFKSVNDTYGHLAGDEVLRVFSSLMKSCYRASDIFCRYGGEEFLIVLPDMAHETARERTEYLRAMIEETPVVYGESVIRVTASFGVATFPRDAKNRDTLIAAADQALYASKHDGRNRIKSYSEVVRSSHSKH